MASFVSFFISKLPRKGREKEYKKGEAWDSGLGFENCFMTRDRRLKKFGVSSGVESHGKWFGIVVTFSDC